MKVDSVLRWVLGATRKTGCSSRGMIKMFLCQHSSIRSHNGSGWQTPRTRMYRCFQLHSGKGCRHLRKKYWLQKSGAESRQQVDCEIQAPTTATRIQKARCGKNGAVQREAGTVGTVGMLGMFWTRICPGLFVCLFHCRAVVARTGPRFRNTEAVCQQQKLP